ncbi:acireductone synthase [Parashewanella spongiae]|uniref:Enolase-phosphatase E1 n=1 Tax=Parashewanella spongiae TaxID=342950 RepID=A0A3A6TLD6_9GAMM|nr:acireductone synthase [Parashewanella spongiae]MCL1078505.1 acireductone synthase [Parashewanella spongiae]RJY14702.1 acireductone synthase [Parashewanella spongiae]
MGIRALIVDTAGTTTDLSFIEDVLFPYSAKVLPQFLEQHKDDVLVENCICDVKDIALEPDANLSRVSEILLQWIKEDRKATPLKTLQGLIWKQGYSDNTFTGHIYPDFIDAVQRYVKQNVRVYSFSSGSVDAQKLLFSHSDGGDLTPLFSGHFDTRTGNKTDKQAYSNILNTISLTAKQVLFVSDRMEELKAADDAGMNVLYINRTQSSEKSTYKKIDSFKHLSF